MKDKGYDPRRAFLGMREGFKQLQQQAEREAVPQGIVDAKGTTFRAPVLPTVAEPVATDAPQTLCFLLLAFAHGSAMLPDDFHNVPRTAKGLQAYTRPDGGVYLGAFELPKDPGGVVVVFGDPAMPQERAVAASLAFRKKLHATHAPSPLADLSTSVDAPTALHLES